MNCMTCGAVIPDGMTNCPQCGQPVQMAYQQPMGGYQQPMGQPMQQPMGYQQPMGQPMQQPMGGYQQPMGQPMQQQMGYQQPMGGYQQPMGQPMYQAPMGGGFNSAGFMNDMKTNYMKLIGLIGALLIFISPFFNWVSYSIKYDGEKEKDHLNMFKFGSDGVGIFTFYAIMFLILGLALIAFALADYIPALQRLKMLPNVQYIEIGIVAAALLILILAFFNGEYKDGIEALKSMVKLAKLGGVSGHAGRGLGPMFALLGIIASAFPRVTALLKK